MEINDYINGYIRERIQGDGGEVSFVSLEDSSLTLLFRGECSKCGILDRCCDWIEERIAKDLNMNVKITPVRKRPYFQDK
ncbi:MAG: NifU family protein [Clostridia bacterium]|nr:NifU family protein [Clostridia bacterium]